MAQIELPFLLVFPLSQHFQPTQSTQQPPLPKPHRPSTPSICLRRHLSIRSASPSHARHIQSWHSLVALFCFFFLLSSLPAALVLAHLCSSISLSSLFSAGLTCMIIFILSSFHPPLCALSLLLGHQNQSDSRRSYVLRLRLLPPPLCLSSPYLFLSVP